MNSYTDTSNWYRALPGSSEPRFSRSQAGRPNFYVDVVRGQSNRLYPDYGSFNDEPNYQSSSNNFKERPYEGRMMHRDDKYFDDTFIQSNPMSEIPGQYNNIRGWNSGVSYGRDQVKGRSQGLERYIVQSGRNQYGNSRMTHSSSPRVKYNSHNLPTDLNALRMVHSVGRGGMEVVNSSR